MIKSLYILLLLLCLSSSAQKNDVLFEKSYSLLNSMLEHPKEYSFKNAVFSVENAYLDGNLDTIAINGQIKVLHNLSLSLIRERFLYYPERDKETVNKWASIFQVMCDTIPLNIKDKNYSYIPYGYDFKDVFGHQQWSDMFVSKLLITRKGNCHSLPYLYKILAEELGVEANLALAPNHIYIKHKSVKDGWYNTELTSGIFPIDAWLMASGYIHIDAIKNGVYMKALDNNESIALVLVDLAQGYQNKFPENDGAFILKCCEAAIRVYPNFANALILKAETHKTQIGKEQSPEVATAQFKELEKEYAHIHRIGYRNMPESMYLGWLLTLKTERNKYENKKLDTFNER